VREQNDLKTSGASNPLSFPGFHPDVQSKRLERGASRRTAKSAILKSLDYPVAGESVLKELGVLKESWDIDGYMIGPEFFQDGDRWFVGVPVEKIPATWFDDSDLIPMQPHEMYRIESERDSL
jgi:hypothetical protein